MQTLGMAGGKLELQVQPDPDASALPAAGDEHRVSGQRQSWPAAQPLAKVASGGELSRISLAIQVSLAQSSSRCMVFDEVDAGVGGAVAEIVGRELARLGAAGAGAVRHPSAAGGRAGRAAIEGQQANAMAAPRAPSVKALSIDERIAEIARMLGGVDITDRAREHAREMLGARGDGSIAGTAATRTDRPAATSIKYQ